MALKTLSELRSNIGSTIRETQINSLIDTFINLTIADIHNYHPWTWLRRKQTFTTVASQEDYALDEEVDRIGLIRQIATPHKLFYVPDALFYKFVPDPENLSTGVPYYYRLWEETGFSTALAAADTVYVNSSSTSDGSAFTVRLVGRESTNNLVVSETLTLNGTTNVTSTNTYAASGLMQISKSAATTGTISCFRTTGATVLARISPEEIAPRYKKISLFPIPSSAVTTYVEYYERVRLLVADTDVPQMDHKWNWVLREGALAKAWEYKQNDAATALHTASFLRGLERMRQQDLANADYIPVVERRFVSMSDIIRYSDSVGGNFPSYAIRA